MRRLIRKFVRALVSRIPDLCVDSFDELPRYWRSDPDGPTMLYVRSERRLYGYEGCLLGWVPDDATEADMKFARYRQSRRVAGLSRLN